VPWCEPTFPARCFRDEISAADRAAARQLAPRVQRASCSLLKIGWSASRHLA
jgi:hypothetical protein